ncbi:MAG: hypothetical protein IJD97_05980 [Clostridia bacterium]|nr:hypothetical protein [Clostridia bacterium]
MKKIIALLLTGIMVLSLTACGGTTFTLTQVCDEDETKTATVTIGYGGSTVLDEAMLTDDSAELINEEKDFSMEFYLYYYDGYDYYVEDAKTYDGFKEVKYSGFEGYMYPYDEFEYEVCLKLDEADNCQVMLFAYVAPASDLIDTETTDIEAIFNQKEVQDILGSIKYKG